MTILPQEWRKRALFRGQHVSTKTFYWCLVTKAAEAVEFMEGDSEFSFHLKSTLWAVRPSSTWQLIIQSVLFIP